MNRRKPKKVVSARTQTATVALRKELSKRKKAELIEILLGLAKADPKIGRQLTARLDAALTPEELVAETHRAIADATDFDERDVNHNFDFDSAAYDQVKRNLGRLVEAGRLPLAMQLALELMKRGSYQVEMSDEGLMTGDIEDCLRVVITAVENCDFPAAEVAAWCSAMLANDRVKFIVRTPLQSLRDRFEG